MKVQLKALGIAVASAALVAGLSGCITINVQDSSNKNANEPAANASNAANDNAGTDNAATNESGKNENISGTANSNTTNINDNSNWGRGDAEPIDSDQKVGSAKVGYIYVPADWIDRTSKDFSEREVDATGVVYVVDPTTEFTSATLSHFAFASSIKMEVYNTGFATKLTEIMDKFKADPDHYSAPVWTQAKIAGHDAAKITTTMTDDGVNVTVYSIDANDGAKSCVILTGFSTPSNIDAVEGYMESWTK